jgi:hypothetical protein
MESGKDEKEEAGRREKGGGRENSCATLSAYIARLLFLYLRREIELLTIFAILEVAVGKR